MNLSRQDADLFFRLIGALHLFVNRKLKMYPKIKTIDDYDDSDKEDQVAVRDALYQDIKLIDAFIEENPDNFSKTELSIVSGWKHFVRGDFYIERFLKTQTILIGGDDVYGVLGFYQSFAEMIHSSNLPLSVGAVLLPFKGKIIYDGIFQARKIYFGSGMKQNLKEVYMRAKQNNRIITSLEKGEVGYQEEAAGKPLKDWNPELEEIVAKVKKLRGSAGQPALYTPAFALAKASVEFARLAVSDPDDMENLYDALKKANRALKKAGVVLDRQE